MLLQSVGYAIPAGSGHSRLLQPLQEPRYCQPQEEGRRHCVAKQQGRVVDPDQDPDPHGSALI